MLYLPCRIVIRPFPLRLTFSRSVTCIKISQRQYSARCSIPASLGRLQVALLQRIEYRGTKYHIDPPLKDIPTPTQSRLCKCENILPGWRANTTKTGGTIKAIVILYFSMLAQNWTGSNRVCITTGTPMEKGKCNNFTVPMNNWSIANRGFKGDSHHRYDRKGGCPTYAQPEGRGVLP